MNAPVESSALTLVSGERFFVKEVALDPGAGAATQVELAIEQSSPFPLAQLYHGFVVSPDRRLALAFAAYRHRFTAGEQAEWPAARAVLPAFLALAGPPSPRPLVVVQVDATGLNGVAWDGRAGLPVAVVSKSLPTPAEPAVAEAVAELRQRLGGEEAEVRRLDGPVDVGLAEDGAAVFRIAGAGTARLPAAAVAEADIRDKSFLAEKLRGEKRRRGWTGALLATAALWLVALGLELAAAGLGAWNQRRRDLVGRQAEEVRHIETAQTLAIRIEDLAARQERPLEWLSAVSAVRPHSVQFTRVVSNNDRSLTIDAQTADAAAVGGFESALRQHGGMERIEVRDIRSREGLTSFVLAISFKPAAASAVGGQP